jgi:predicted TIM-barrel fold metal-dependent hydrolase
MTHLVFSGVFEKLPGIKIITHHMGAMVPFFAGRVGVGFEEFAEFAPDPNLHAARAALSRPPSDYYRMFHADTALFGAEAGVRCGLSYFGVQKTLFGSDAPFGRGAANIAATIRLIEDLEITDEDRDCIFAGNAKKLLRL